MHCITRIVAAHKSSQFQGFVYSGSSIAMWNPELVRPQPEYLRPSYVLAWRSGFIGVGYLSSLDVDAPKSVVRRIPKCNQTLGELVNRRVGSVRTAEREPQQLATLHTI